MEHTNLHARLDVLGDKIATAQRYIRQNETLFKQSHHLTAQQLADRYRLLKQKLDHEVADEEAHGHHISDLEQSVRAWFENLDAKI